MQVDMLPGQFGELVWKKRMVIAGYVFKVMKHKGNLITVRVFKAAKIAAEFRVNLHTKMVDSEVRDPVVQPLIKGLFA